MRPQPARDAPERFDAIWCCELELGARGGLRAVRPRPPESRFLRVLVRLHGAPLGYLEVEGAEDADAAELRNRAAGKFGAAIAARLGLEACGFDAHDLAERAATVPWPERPESDVAVSVVVCTRNRAEILDACLASLTSVRYPNAEFLIVDNAPTDGRTKDLVARYAADDPRLSYRLEPRPGLSTARNCGLRAATGDVIAYTDDDVVVDDGWVGALARSFAERPDVACTTGLVCTSTVTTAAEAYFDARAASWSTRCEPELFDLGSHTRPDLLYPYSAGIFGTGANVAFRRSVLIEVGDFDEALGAGTRTRGGEDLDMFVRILRAGHAIAYEPAAIVWHHHRADPEALLRQMYGYGTGLTAYLTKLLVARETGTEILRRVPGGLRRAVTITRSTRDSLGSSANSPRGAVLHEVAGYLAGPWLYMRERRRVRNHPAGAVGRERFVAPGK